MRRVDIDEESYFNGDDDDDDDESVAPGPHPAPSPLPTLLSPPLSRFQFGQKRKRQRAPSIPLRSGLAGVTQRALAPATPIHLPRTPPISALVEYGEDDEQTSDPENALLESLVSSKPSARTANTIIPMTPTPPSAITANATAANAGTGIGTGAGGFVPLRTEKRRRNEEDEEEMGLERLIGGKSKRSTKTGATGSGEENPKRIRLRFGAASLAAASSTLPAARSSSGAKDGDTG
jgi:protein phosphatase 4 regulatory subunit 3